MIIDTEKRLVIPEGNALHDARPWTLEENKQFLDGWSLQRSEYPQPTRNDWPAFFTAGYEAAAAKAKVPQ